MRRARATTATVVPCATCAGSIRILERNSDCSAVGNRLMKRGEHLQCPRGTRRMALGGKGGRGRGRERRPNPRGGVDWRGARAVEGLAVLVAASQVGSAQAINCGHSYFLPGALGPRIPRSNAGDSRFAHPARRQVFSEFSGCGRFYLHRLRRRQVLRSPRLDFSGFGIVREVRSWILFCICGGSHMYIVSGGADKRGRQYLSK